jgi:hypothetical protein
MHSLPGVNDFIEMLGSSYQYLAHIASFGVTGIGSFGKRDGSIRTQLNNHDCSPVTSMRVRRVVILWINPKTNATRADGTHSDYNLTGLGFQDDQ